VEPIVAVWPTSLGPDDLLYVAEDTSDETVKYLVLYSKEKDGTFIRDGRAWAQVEEETLEDTAAYRVKLSFIPFFDKQEEAEKKINVADIRRFIEPEDMPITAAAAADCPPATQDVALNLRNRENAIKSAGYGPLNPKLPNTEFWQKKADRWTVSPDDAKQSLCGNCAAFIVTSKMLDCIAEGLKSGGGPARDAWETVEAGALGYCEAFDFKCAASRTCDAWITGGPVTGD